MSTEKKSLYTTFLRNFYLFRFFNDFAFVYAVYILFFKLKGLSVFEISLLLALWSGFVILFEVPTGALADRWSRKHMLTLGMLFKAIGFGVWYFADGFWIFALGFLFWGLQETFCSGTQEALLFDNLKAFGKEDEYEKIAGKGHFYSKIAVGLSVFLGGFIASINFDLVIVLSCVCMLIAIIPTLLLNDVKYQKKDVHKAKYIHLLRDALRTSKNDMFIKRLFLYTIIVLAVVGVLDEYEQLFFDHVGLPIRFFGVLIVFRMGFEAAGTRLAHLFTKYFPNQKGVYVLACLGGILLMIAVTFRSLIMLPFFALIFLFGAMGEVLIEANLQRRIPSHQRATILSINSMLLNLSAIFLTVGFGILSKMGDLRWGFYAFAILILLFSILSMIFKQGVPSYVKE